MVMRQAASLLRADAACLPACPLRYEHMNTTWLSIIIPFLNEGAEIRHTVENIRQTAAGPVDIWLIDDASNDGYDYPAVAREYGAHYIRHTARKGVAASRDEGVARAETDYVMLLDGHMRFAQNAWDAPLRALLPTDRRAIWCGRTRALVPGADGRLEWRSAEQTAGYGAFMELDSEAWGIDWNHHDPAPGEDVCDIPCILGACYAFYKPYWLRLGGLRGLQQYGLDEQLISYKAWMEGGRCKLIKSLDVGHLYRKRFPYRMTDNYREFNRLLLTELLLPAGRQQEAFRHLFIRRNGTDMYLRFARRLNRRAAELELMRAELDALRTVSFEEIAGMNRRVARLNRA